MTEDKKKMRKKKSCNCWHCPHFEVNYNSGFIATHCCYDDGEKCMLIYTIDTNKGTPKNCPLRKNEPDRDLVY